MPSTSDPCWTLGQISEETGGLHIDRLNDLIPGIETIHRAAGTYYSLGATLEATRRKTDGNRVELVCRRPGVKLHLRRRVVAREASDAAFEATEASLLFGATGSALPLEFRLGDGKRSGRLLAPKREIVFVIRIPIASLELEEKNGAREADVEMTFASVDARGDVSAPVVIKAPLRIPEAEWEQARAAIWPYEGRLVSRPGEQRYVVTVRDVRSNRLGTAEVTGRFD
jgi:hypothetical protein